MVSSFSVELLKKSTNWQRKPEAETARKRSLKQSSIPELIEWIEGEVDGVSEELYDDSDPNRIVVAVRGGIEPRECQEFLTDFPID
jgi:hypothetical protein